MPLNTVQTYLKGVLNGVIMPLDLGTLDAVIAPPNPEDDVVNPMAYIWGSRGAERRESVPRAVPGDLSTGGWKILEHDVDIWLVWFGAADDQFADQQFPSVIDAVCAVLRNVAILDQTQHATDPVTGQQSDLLNVGENLSWEYAPVKAVADQRYLRYDAQIGVSITEYFQA
jgi:hypothetical protein